MSKLKVQIEKAILGQRPLIYVLCSEETRILPVLELLSTEKSCHFETWSCFSGLSKTGSPDETKDPCAAIKAILDGGKKGIYVFRDLSEFIDKPDVKRALREFNYSKTGGIDQFLFIISPELKMPDTLREEIHLIDVLPPDEGEISAEFNRIRENYPNTRIPEEFNTEIMLALKGLSISGIDSILHRIFKNDRTEREIIFNEIFDEKESIVRKTGYLEFIPPREMLANVGGLGNLKEWLIKREKVFTKEAVDAGITPPKGLLVMGVSGCGKSLAVKTVSSLWKLPLFRLDMNLIFSGLYGNPEATFHKALQTLNAVAPVILWIDEIENALGLEEAGGLSISSHIFSSFLTWMQEKPPLIFIAATANKIQALPAEIIRKGRFDQVFFVDLPDDQERREIFTIYLKKYADNLEQFDLKMLSIMTNGWNGAEIAQIVAAARTDAHYEKRPFTQGDITANINITVPLSTTMEQQIKAIRNWALSRATPASSNARILRF
ncbi:MAG: AAA family ATPase [Victivallales bacterium]